MLPSHLFRHCPVCGARSTSAPNGKTFTCDACEFHYHFNPTVAAAALILDAPGRILCIRRAREPQQGKLAFPGGFIDIGETAETALRREIREEVGLEVGAFEFLCSLSNNYVYKSVAYPVLDLVFLARTSQREGALAGDEVLSVCWMRPEELHLEELAFPSLRLGMEVFLARHGPGVPFDEDASPCVGPLPGGPNEQWFARTEWRLLRPSLSARDPGEPRSDERSYIWQEINMQRVTTLVVL